MHIINRLFAAAILATITFAAAMPLNAGVLINGTFFEDFNNLSGANLNLTPQSQKGPGTYFTLSGIPGWTVEGVNIQVQGFALSAADKAVSINEDLAANGLVG